MPLDLTKYQPIIDVIVAAFKTDAAESYLKQHLQPYLGELQQFAVLAPLVATVTATLLAKTSLTPAEQTEVIGFISNLGTWLHDLSTPAA